MALGLVRPSDGSSPLLVAALATVVAFIVTLPVVMIGLVVGSLVGDARSERRSRLIARGETSMTMPSGTLEMRSSAKKPLDDLGAARATANGAATTVIRDYFSPPNPSAMLATDAARLAQIGYSLISTEFRPPRSGIGWILLGLFMTVLSLAAGSALDLPGGIDSYTRGRLTATFELRSTTHEPVPVSLSPAAQTAVVAEAAEARI